MTEHALILAAHGSGDESPANALVRSLARELTHRQLFHQVMATFNLGTPRFAEALDATHSERVVVVPVMTSDGYFCETVLPRELARSVRFAQVDLHIAPALGTHVRMGEIVARIANAAMKQHAIIAPETAIILVGHGTAKHARSGTATALLCDKLRGTAICARVEAAFLDQDPRIEELPARLAQRNIVVIPFLLGGGHHAIYDIPARLGLTTENEKDIPTTGRVDGRNIFITDAVGSDPAIVDIIVDLAREAVESAALSTIGGQT